MSLEKIGAALEAALAAISPAIDTAYENAKYEPDADTPYQKATLLSAPPENPTFGAGFYRERGIFQVSLFYPLRNGVGDAVARAELIRAAFARGTALTNSGVTTIIERTPEIMPGSADGTHWMVPVRIRYFANITT